MATKAHMAEYNSFMEWFKKNYPEMYGQYWSNIIMPVDDSGVGVNDDKIDDESFERIVDLISQFYNHKPFH